MVVLLLQARADVAQVNREGSTALLLAAGEGFDGIVERLLKAGADVNHKNALGNSALHKAAGHGMHFSQKSEVLCKVALQSKCTKNNKYKVNVLESERTLPLTSRVSRSSVDDQVSGSLRSAHQSS